MSSKGRRAVQWVVAGVLVLGAGALAVGSIGTSTSSTFGHTGTTVGGPAAALAPAKAAASEADASQAASLPDVPDRISRTADLTVQVEKGRFDSAWAAAFSIAARYGGQIMSSTRGVPTPQPVPLGGASRETSAAPPIGDITMRIPAASFTEVTNALRALGTVQGDTTATQDVSQEYVDLQSRLRNLRGEQAVLLKLFDRASTVKDILAVQGQLTTVEGQIEQVTGRIKYLDSRTVFSTVTLHVREPGVVVVTNASPGPSLGGAWDTAKKGLVRIAGASLILGLWLAPFAAVVLAGFGLRRVLRRPAPQA